MPSIRSKTTAALVAAVVFAGGTGIAVSSTGSLSSADPEPETPVVAGPSPAARATFSVINDTTLKTKAALKLAELNAGQPAIPGAPKSTAAPRTGTGDLIVQDLGARKTDVAFARSVGKLDVLVTPGSKGLCVISSGPYGSSAGCDSEQDVASGKGFSVSGCLNQSNLTIYGLVPNGLKSVTLTSRSGVEVSADVVNNVAGYSVASDTKLEAIPVTVSWRTDAGDVSAPVPTPSNPTC